MLAPLKESISSFLVTLRIFRSSVMGMDSRFSRKLFLFFAPLSSLQRKIHCELRD